MIISSILLVGGIVLIFTNIDLSKSTKTYNINVQNAMLSRSCLEEALLRVSVDTSYTGTINLTVSSGTCTVIISNHSNPSLKVLNITTVVQGYTYTLSKNVNITMSPIQVVN